jgi:quercetin dioxygenase-like cupin family protein
MLKKLIPFAAIAALSFAGGVYAQQAGAPVQPPPVKRTPLGKVEVPGSNYEVVFGMAELQPGFKAGRHSHPGSVLAYVVDGQFMLALDGQAEKTFAAGQSLEVPNAAIHNEGAVGSKPAKLIAVYVVEKGKPLVQPAR